MPPPTTPTVVRDLRGVDLGGVRIEESGPDDGGGIELRGRASDGVRLELVAVRLPFVVDDERRAALLATLRDVQGASLADPALIPIAQVEVVRIDGVDHALLGWPRIEGPTLAEELGARIAPLEALGRLASIARALDLVHGRGLHHGALGLDSIVRVDGAPRLRRFGETILRAQSDAPATRPRASLAPECLDPALGPIGPWTDVFGLALSFVELVAGRGLRASTPPNELFQRLVDRERRPSLRGMGVGVAASIERVLHGALMVDPRARPLRASELWRPLADAVRAAPDAFSLQPSARPRPPPVAPPSPPAQRRATPQWAIGAAIAVGVGAFALQTAVRPRSSAPRPVDRGSAAAAVASAASAAASASIVVAVAPASSAPPAAPPDMIEVALDGARFTLDRTELTVEAYRKCVDAGACTTTPEHGLSWIADDPFRRHHVCNLHVEGRDRHPVNCLTWRQARAYCAWAGKRLPTGREWEAAAGGRATRFPWGKEPPTCTRVVFARYGAEQWGCREQPVGTAPVDAHPESASPLGALDLAGNVWEWTSDRGDGGTALLRGGGWDSSERSLEVKATLEQAIYNGDVNVGARCAR